MYRFIFGFLGVYFSFINISLAFPQFPMTIHGNLKVGSNDLGTGAVLTFSDGSGNILGNYTTTQAGSYGFESATSGVSPTFSEYSGTLQIGVKYLAQTYAISSIVGSTQDCPSISSITFTSNICRYDITVSAPVVAPPRGGSSGSSGGSPSSSSSATTTNLQTAIPLVTSSQNTVSISPPNTSSLREFPVTIQDIKKSKTILTKTDLKRGTIITIYRVLPNGRQIRAGTTRVIANGNFRFKPRVAGQYTFISEKPFSYYKR